MKYKYLAKQTPSSGQHYILFRVSGTAMTGLRPHLLNERGSDDNFSDDESSPLTHDIYGGR